ncbi:hypothetical protein [Neobacillus mesonae]|uniref:hypothetical protein n=1 Tax=Neobacillus mesonae TaxID=1193713 RepID=UPI00203C1F2F|nr:hypothetical protein [Neobacillus mesonae]MCM3569183.1 hypothetical protein [Neobacillus mesonae]
MIKVLEGFLQNLALLLQNPRPYLQNLEQRYNGRVLLVKKQHLYLQKDAVNKKIGTLHFKNKGENEYVKLIYKNQKRCDG